MSVPDDTKPSDGERPVLECWNVEYSFIAITPNSTLTQSVSTCKGPIYGLNRTV